MAESAFFTSNRGKQSLRLLLSVVQGMPRGRGSGEPGFLSFGVRKIVTNTMLYQALGLRRYRKNVEQILEPAPVVPCL